MTIQTSILSLQNCECVRKNSRISKRFRKHEFLNKVKKEQDARHTNYLNMQNRVLSIPGPIAVRYDPVIEL